MKKSYFMGILLIGLISLILLVPGRGYASQGFSQEERIPGADTIPYRGYLTDLDGRPVPDGRYDFTFTLYGGEAAVDSQWSEQQIHKYKLVGFYAEAG